MPWEKRGIRGMKFYKRGGKGVGRDTLSSISLPTQTKKRG
jgi:hypothetical protein